MELYIFHLQEDEFIDLQTSQKKSFKMLPLCANSKTRKVKTTGHNFFMCFCCARLALINRSQVSFNKCDICQSWKGAECTRHLNWWEELGELVRQQIATSRLSAPISAPSPDVSSLSSSLCTLQLVYTRLLKAHTELHGHTLTKGHTLLWTYHVKAVFWWSDRHNVQHPSSHAHSVYLM